MKKRTIVALSSLLVLGYATWSFASEPNNTQRPWVFMNGSNVGNGTNFGAMMTGTNNGANFAGGMMGGLNQIPENAQLLDEATIKQKINDYLAQYSSNVPLVADDLFEFKNSSYYVSVLEKNTGRGAMELLINPYTGAISPEPGPNMMWNLKYGMGSMMGGNFAGGMMGGGGMMNGFGNARPGTANVQPGTGNGNPVNNGYTDNKITKEDAIKAANEYLAANMPGTSVGNEAHAFYGYYTLHVMKDGQTVGMLSVNGITGNVWYHNWHGDVVKVAPFAAE